MVGKVEVPKLPVPLCLDGYISRKITRRSMGSLEPWKFQNPVSESLRGVSLYWLCSSQGGRNLRAKDREEGRRRSIVLLNST